MWSRLILCLFVGLAYATHSPAWNVGKEYSYHVHGRSLALLSETSKEYTGIVFNATLRVQPVAENKLLFEIRDTIYSQILNKLPYWNVDSSKDWEWKPLELSSRPFEIEMQNGVITDLIVSKDTPNWESNILKSIVSQFQLNTMGENIIESPMNILPRAGRNSATYKTMEHTVTGHTETLYSINEMPQYILQSTPRWAKHEKHYNPEHPIIEIVKHKNYTNYIELPSYIHGLRNLLFKPTGDQYGSFMSRECLSNALVTGSLDDFTVHTASTTETVTVQPLLTEELRSSIVSYMHVHLKEMTEQQDKIQSVPNPVRVGNLVYSYAVSNSNPRIRTKSESQQSGESTEDLESYQIEASPLDQPPQTPLLPFSIGYKGMSIKHKVDIVKHVVKRAQQIANDIEDCSRPIPLNVMDKFTNLVVLVRLMDVEEIKQAYNQLYTTKRDGQQYYSWVALRDAVAESGTGPSLLTIREWSLSNKISTTEASDLIETISKTVQQPTVEFMRTLFDLIKSPSVQEARYLNRTAPLSYASLVRRVYVSRSWKTDIQYASNSFGNFITEEGKRFVEGTVVPYFTKKLEQSISQADTEKIHIYIRVLGNIAHPKILAAFEPYLEGQKHCSPFQRFLMVISLDKLVGIHSDLGIPIMYKIYRNVGERQEIRIAAVYTLMKAYNIPQDMLADMLKSMSMYTNIDHHEHVNAAIKSIIQSFANLKHGIGEMNQSARSAKPFLNQKTYGSQYGSRQVFDDILKQIQTNYIHNIETVTSEDDRYPMGFEYSAIQGISELVEKSIILQGSTSSLEELISQFEKLIQWTHIQKEKQQQQQQTLRKEHVWSSQNIARLLNMTSWERPQLEGFLYAEINGYLQSLSFNNHSIEELPEAVRYIELQLRDGQRFSTLKFRNMENLKVSFPNAMGLPFAYIYKQPSVLRAQGNIKASAHPQVSEDNKLNMPETLRVKADTSVTFVSTTQGVLSFIAPFDHQKYACGFDRVFRAHIPIRADVDLNLKKMQMKMQLQLKNLDDETQMLHYSTWPYTTRIDILNPQSIPKEPNTKVWQSDNMRTYEQTFGEKESGVAFRVKVQRDRKYMDLGRVSKIFWDQGPVEALLALYRVDEIQKSSLDLYVVPEQSTTNRIVIHLGRKQETMDENNKGGNFKRSTESESTSERMQQAMKSASQSIKSGKVQGFDVCVEFEGSRSTNYSATAGYAMSFEHPSKSKLFVMLKKQSERPGIKPFEITLESTTTLHNGNWWQVPKAIESRPTMKSQLEVTFGQSQEDLSKVKGETEFTRSEDRIKFVQRQPIYEQCQREMKDGNKYLHACMTIMGEASRLDDMRMKLQVEKMSPQGRHMLQDVRKFISQVLYSNLPVETLRDIEATKEWSMKARFDPDLKYVNLSAEFDDEQYRMNNIAVNKYASELFVPSTFIKTSTLLAFKAVGLNYYRPMCAVDKTRISNFNNVTFPADLSKDWTVMFQYVPHEARQGSERRPVHQQLKSQLRNYVILVRENEYAGKDVKIAFSTPTTDYENVEFTLTFDGRTTKISVNGQKLLEDLEQKSMSMYNGRVVLSREPPTGEVSFELTDRFHLVYDGQRVRLFLEDYGFQNTARGICGQLNQEPMKDFLTPQNCIARDHKKFIRSYELSDEGKVTRKQLSESNTECVPQREYLFADVISSEEAQRIESGEDMGECTRFQTLYTESLSEICFTTRPMPVCKSRCSPRGTLSKKVAVHCISNSPVAKLWKTQIDKGASPDFSHKPQTKYVSMKLPQQCVQ